MAHEIPTTQDLANRSLTTLEGALAQNAPLHDKAFLRVLAAVKAMLGTGLYKYAAERALQNLAQTATGADLDLLGAEIRVYRKAAEQTILTVSLPAAEGVTIGVTTSFIGEKNGLPYDTVAEVIAGAGGTVSLSVGADAVGAAGNLSVGDVLNIVAQVAGAGTVATVTAVTNTGADEEGDDSYRQRVLFAQRAVRGGGNPADHRIWAEEVAGVKRAFPYAGRPGGVTSYPGDRTVYIEAETNVDPDGIPGAGLLTEVRSVLNIDPVTYRSRPGLGQTNANLWVEPIERVAVDVTVTGLTAPAGTEAAVRASIESALTAYMLSVMAYVEGVDLPQDRNDTVTTTSISKVVQGVLTDTGGSAASVAFSVSGESLVWYDVLRGKLVKLGTVTYAVA